MELERVSLLPPEADRPMQGTPLVTKVTRALIFAIHEGTAHQHVVGVEFDFCTYTEVVFAQIYIAVKVVSQKTGIEPDIRILVLCVSV